MAHTKMYSKDLDSPRRELSNGGLGIVVALTAFRELIFRVFILGVQSSCTPEDSSSIPGWIEVLSVRWLLVCDLMPD